MPKIYRSLSPSAARRCFQAVLLTMVTVLCAGCKSCGHDEGFRTIDRSGFGADARAATSMAVPEPSDATASSVLDPRAVKVAPTVEELNERAHAEGLLVEVYFDFDRSDLGAEARAALERNARFLRQEPGVRLTIEGHCDERGTHEYNLALGQLRASTAREFLIRLGIEPGRLATVSYGEHEIVCFASNEACWALNRRAYFRITGRITDVG